MQGGLWSYTTLLLVQSLYSLNVLIPYFSFNRLFQKGKQYNGRCTNNSTAAYIGNPEKYIRLYNEYNNLFKNLSILSLISILSSTLL